MNAYELCVWTSKLILKKSEDEIWDAILSGEGNNKKQENDMNDDMNIEQMIKKMFHARDCTEQKCDCYDADNNDDNNKMTPEYIDAVLANHKEAIMNNGEKLNTLEKELKRALNDSNYSDATDKRLDAIEEKLALYEKRTNQFMVAEYHKHDCADHRITKLEQASKIARLEEASKCECKKKK